MTNGKQIISVEAKFPLPITIIVILILPSGKNPYFAGDGGYVGHYDNGLFEDHYRDEGQSKYGQERRESSNKSLSSSSPRVQQRNLEQKEEIVVIQTTKEVLKEAPKEDKESVLGGS